MKKFLCCLVGGLLLVGMASYSIARPGNGRWGGGRQGFTFWKMEEVVEKLALTPDQVQLLDDIEYTFQAESIDPEAQLKKARLEMDHLLSRDTYSEEEIGRLVDEITAGSTERIKLGLNKKIAIRKVLTPEQWAQLDQMREKMIRKMRRKGNRWGGPGKGRGYGGEGRGRGRGGPDQDEEEGQ